MESMPPEETRNSKPQLFLLRIWYEQIGAGLTDWRGRIQHVDSGEVVYFRDLYLMEKFIMEHSVTGSAGESG